MIKRLLIGLAVASCLAALPASSEQLVQQFSGLGASTTPEFEAQAPWILDWRVNSEYQQSMAIEIHLVDGVTGFHKGLVVYTKRPGNGVRMFNQSGSFRFRISATHAKWNLKIIELSREEAELYTPRP